MGEGNLKESCLPGQKRCQPWGSRASPASALAPVQPDFGEAVARLRGCSGLGLGFCLSQNKKAASGRGRCFAKIAKGACAAAPSLKIIYNFKLSRANSTVPSFPSQRGAAARAWERVLAGAREAAAAQRLAKAAAGRVPPNLHLFPRKRSPKYRRQVRSTAHVRHSLLPLKARLTNGKYLVFCSG